MTLKYKNKNKIFIGENVISNIILTNDLPRP